MTLQPLLDASPVIQLHAVAAIASFILGSVVLLRRKGTPSHKVAGRLWVALMVVVAGSSFFIHTIRMWGLWSPIHLLSIATLAALVYAVAMIRRHNVAAHERAMKATYVGALLIAGAFTLAPGRIMNHVVFGAASPAAKVAASPAHGVTVAGVLANTPLWVWAVLLYVLYIGWSNTRDRVVAPLRLLVMPAVISALAIYNLLSLGASPRMVFGFACGAAAGALAGHAVGRRRVTRLREDGLLEVRGDWMSLVLVVTIFLIRYVMGVMAGVDPSLAHDAGFMLAGATLSGLFAAMMVARTVTGLPRDLLHPSRLVPASAQKR